MLGRYDTNKDGNIDQSEVDALAGSTFLGGRFRDMDLNKDGKVNSGELNKYLENYARPR